MKSEPGDGGQAWWGMVEINWKGKGWEGSPDTYSGLFITGEVKKGKVTGFHNWIRFYLQEKEGLLDYYSHNYDGPVSPWAGGASCSSSGCQADLLLIRSPTATQQEPCPHLLESRFPPQVPTVKPPTLPGTGDRGYHIQLGAKARFLDHRTHHAFTPCLNAIVTGWQGCPPWLTELNSRFHKKLLLP